MTFTNSTKCIYISFKSKKPRTK